MLEGVYSVARVNQVAMKDTCFEFVINVSRQGKNVKIKLNLKIKFAEIADLIFCEINDNTPGFCLVLSRHIHNPVKQVM